SPSTTVCVHLAQPQKYDSMTTFFGGYAGNGGKWDMSVFSSYGSASVAAGIVANMKKISSAYGKPFMQSEFGGPVNRVSSTGSARAVRAGVGSAAAGKGYYVAPAGSDSAAGTLAAPWASIAHAQAAVAAGDTVYFRGGTYTYTRADKACKSGTDRVDAITLDK